VGTIKVVRDKISKKSKGYAFLEVADNAGAERAIDALDGLAMGDRILKINKVAEETGKISDKQAVVTRDRARRPRKTIQ
jgi:RNA recognition motif-containing protein